MKDNKTEAGAQRVSELLQARAKKMEAGCTHDIPGMVSVTVDSHMRLTAVRLLEGSIEASKRQALEQAIIDAVNAAMQRVVKSSAESLLQLRSSDDWKSAMAELFKGEPRRSTH